MEDRELLELAAKAAGLKNYRYCPANVMLHDCIVYDDEDGQPMVWMPHLDDGDCARLEAVLGIDTCWWDERIEAFACHKPAFWDAFEYYSDHNNRQAARRMAVLKVAAKIGEAQKLTD